MNTFNQELAYPLSFKIDKRYSFRALKNINQGIKSIFVTIFSVIKIRLIILAARFQKQSNMFFLILQIF